MRTSGLLVLLALLAVVGLCVAITGWQQPAPSLARTLRHLRRPAAVAPSATGRYLNGSVMQWAAAGARRFPRLLPTDVQLRLVGRSLEGHIARVGGAAALGVVAPVVFVTAMRSAGMIGLRWFVPVVLAVLAGAVCAVVVHLTTVERAAIVRTDLRHQLSSYLDVVTMLLAGNSGYEGALDQASRAGDGRLFVELRRGMRECAARGASLTDALGNTGSDFGLDELEQVAATAALSAAEGAPVARTLAAKCATLRTALATEQESEARLRTSRLTTPIVGMALIFMALVIYPALSFS